MDLFAIIGVGGLLLIGSGLLGRIEIDKFKIHMLPKWGRISAGILGGVLLIIAIYLYPQSPLNPDTTGKIEATKSALDLTQRALESTQTAFANSPTQTPLILTQIVTQVPVIVTQVITSPVNSNIDDQNGNVPIEFLSHLIWSYNSLTAGAGENVSSLAIKHYSESLSPFYQFDYKLSSNDTDSVQLLFELGGVDFSQYSALIFTLEFKDEKTRVNFRVFDTSDNYNSIVLSSMGTLDNNITVTPSETSRGREYLYQFPIGILSELGISVKNIETITFSSDVIITGEARDDYFTLSNIFLTR